LTLRAISSFLESIMDLPAQSCPTLELAIAKMVEAENMDRRDRKTEAYLKISKQR
jgi:hypothetical protein